MHHPTVGFWFIHVKEKTKTPQRSDQWLCCHLKLNFDTHLTSHTWVCSQLSSSWAPAGCSLPEALFSSFISGLLSNPPPFPVYLSIALWCCRLWGLTQRAINHQTLSQRASQSVRETWKRRRDRTVDDKATFLLESLRASQIRQKFPLWIFRCVPLSLGPQTSDCIVRIGLQGWDALSESLWLPAHTLSGSQVQIVPPRVVIS